MMKESTCFFGVSTFRSLCIDAECTILFCVEVNSDDNRWLLRGGHGGANRQERVHKETPKISTTDMWATDQQTNSLVMSMHRAMNHASSYCDNSVGARQGQPVLMGIPSPQLIRNSH